MNMTKLKGKFMCLVVSLFMIVGIIGSGTASVFADGTPEKIHVSLIIDGYKGNILNETNLEANKGESVKDLLERTLKNKGIKFANASGSYVSSIDGETEFDRPQGPDKDGNKRHNDSGWKYSVNGVFPDHGLSAEYINMDGEEIHWIYVVGAWDTEGFRDVDSVKLDKESLNLDGGASDTLTATVNPSDATDKGIIWSSSDEKVATVDKTGKVTALKAGKATITAASIDNTKHFVINYTPQLATCAVTVTGDAPSVPVAGITLDKTGTVAAGKTLQLNASVQPDNATDKNISWTSDKTDIAAVDKNGVVTGVKEGTATITATTEDGQKTAACTVTVSGSDTPSVPVTGITLDKTGTVAAGKTLQLNASVQPDNATNKNISWTSDKTDIAAVDKNGVVTGVKEGTATITATTEDGKKTAACTVTVSGSDTPPAPVSVTGVTLDKTGTVIVGKTLQLNASVQPDNATNKNVSWTSDKTDIAAVDKNGVVTGVKEGTATITATTEDGQKTAVCTVTVQSDNSKAYTEVITNLINGISSNKSQLTENFGDWTAFGLERAGKSTSIPSNYLDSLTQRVKDHTKDGVLDLRQTTEYERLTLAVLACGGDPLNIAGQNLIEKIYNSDRMEDQGINAYVFGLIAMDAGNFIVPSGATWTRQKLIDSILDCRTKDGGWSYGGTSADPDMTGMAISALAPYKSQSKVSDAVNAAIDALSKIQEADGSYASWNTKNSESCSQTIIGLCANGVDPVNDSRFVKNGKNLMDGLLSFATKTKDGFGHDSTSYNGMGTDQALEALDAYNMFKAGKGSLYRGYNVNPAKNMPVKIAPVTIPTSFKVGDDAVVSVKAENISSEDSSASLILALYDNTGKFVDYVVSSQPIKSGDSTTLTDMMKLPTSGQYTLKVFVWDSMDAMNPLYDGTDISVK
ncbi:Ig-like domain-containing protein [Clostridium sp. AWRP]|uniref:Ig-like domain-containing protein n=1 Tax=Clostridium sp. AWRP TaxID=2212991 RepID=UPI000FDB4ACD|nr:Ig-like domain-containing protein [Clostridium sp. AWRP]AZV57184.1 DUF4430 domain-containing protein [Clostridium sp. AWRP]